MLAVIVFLRISAKLTLNIIVFDYPSLGSSAARPISYSTIPAPPAAGGLGGSDEMRLPGWAVKGNGQFSVVQHLRRLEPQLE